MRIPLMTTDRLRVTGMALVGLTGCLVLGLVVVNTDPGVTAKLTAEAALNRLTFFAGLFCACFGFFSIIAYYLTNRIYPLRRDRGDLRRALQEGGAVAATITGLAILRSVDQLSLISATLLLLAGVVAFTYALTRK